MGHSSKDKDKYPAIRTVAHKCKTPIQKHKRNSKNTNANSKTQTQKLQNKLKIHNINANSTAQTSIQKYIRKSRKTIAKARTQPKPKCKTQILKPGNLNNFLGVKRVTHIVYSWSDYKAFEDRDGGGRCNKVQLSKWL